LTFAGEFFFEFSASFFRKRRKEKTGEAGEERKFIEEDFFLSSSLDDSQSCRCLSPSKMQSDIFIIKKRSRREMTERSLIKKSSPIFFCNGS
jgi:hypothetical protein